MNKVLLVLSLVLMLAMSLMGGALIVISLVTIKVIISGGINKLSISETALIEGEKYVLNQFLGPGVPNHVRDTLREIYQLITLMERQYG